MMNYVSDRALMYANKKSVIDGKNTERNNFRTSKNEIAELEIILKTLKNIHTSANHDMVSDTIFELEYTIAELKLSNKIVN